MDDESVVTGDAAGIGNAPVRVFMSYRRADDHHFIGRLHDRLCGAFGDDMVFRDIDSIPAGTNFRTVILRTLSEVDAVVAVIGPNWVGRAGTDVGSDYVYLELAEALKQGKPVVPALLEGTPMPAPDTLPADLRALTEIHAIFVHGDPAFRRDSGRLIDAIRDVVTSDRARIAQERSVAEENARRIEAERAERERLADELRAEERAARLRLAELEEVATRRQIELERARLEAIAERLRLAEAANDMVPAATERSDVEAAAPIVTPDVEPPPVIAPPEPAPTPPADEPAVIEAPEPAITAPAETLDTAAAASPLSTTEAPPPEASSEAGAATRSPGRLGAELLLHALIVAAFVLGVIAVSEDRDYFGTPFNELSNDSLVDACVWILTLAVGVPVFLRRRPVEQRYVLIGVAASAIFFEFLQASAQIRYGTLGYDEDSWFVLKILQTVCLVGAILVVRRRASPPLPSSPRVQAALVAIAAVCGALLFAALLHQWNQVEPLVESGFLKDRTSFPQWLLCLGLGPIALTLVLATRRSYGARLALATFATLATVNCVSEARFLEQEFELDGSVWIWTALANALLAVVAWSTVAVHLRRAEPSA